MKKIIVLLIVLTAHSSKSEPGLQRNSLVKAKGLFKMNCPSKGITPVAADKNCICKDAAIHQITDCQYIYGAFMPVVGNYY